jgi:hypothetical protein
MAPELLANGLNLSYDFPGMPSKLLAKAEEG